MPDHLPPEPTCTVIVCTRNRPVELDSCLRALSAVNAGDFRLLVVDNGSDSREVREVVRKWRAQYVREPVPGLARARNTGARSCNSEFVAYLDDDCLPEPGWLPALLGAFSDPQVIAAAGRIVAPASEESVRGALDFGPEPRVLDRNHPRWFEIANFGGIGNGGNMAFRRRAFDVWSGFDERLGRGAAISGAEEHYAFFRLIDLGYRITYVPEAVVQHPVDSPSKQAATYYLRDCAAATAYMSLLFWEHSAHRRAVVRYLAQAMLGEARCWRPSHGADPLPRVPQWRKLAAWLHGPLIYWRTSQRTLAASPDLPGSRKGSAWH